MPNSKKLRIDTQVRVPVEIRPLSPEVMEKIKDNPYLLHLKELLEGQAKFLAEGSGDLTVLQEGGELLAEHYAHINAEVIPGVCDPLFGVINLMYSVYGEEVAERMLVDRTHRLAIGLIRGLARMAKQPLKA